MTKLRKGKVLGIAAACLLVASLAGALVAPAILAQGAPSVSIDPLDSGEVNPDQSFTVDVVINAAGRDLIAYELAVGYNSNVMTTTVDDIEFYNLLGGLEVTKSVIEDAGVGLVEYTVMTMPDAPVSDINQSAMEIGFTILPDAAPGDYAIEVVTGVLVGPAPEGLFEDTETNDGTVTIPGAPPPEGPSVSIDPATKEVMAGNTFTIDVLVDAGDNELMGIDVEISYDGNAMTTSGADIETHNDLLGPEAMPLPDYPKVTDGKVQHAIVNPVAAQAGVEGSLMTIEFTVNEDAVPGDYALTITLADLVDATPERIPDVAENDGTVTVLPTGPEVFDETFSEYLARRDREDIWTIPGGASELQINLTTAGSEPDMDLELWDGDTLVIGYRGEISRAPGGTYEDDEFGYSGYSGGVEFITADGPLGRAYDLEVYAYQAGTYTVDVYYEVPVGVDVTPPEIDIDVPATVSLEEEVTIMVTATDPGGSGVAMVMFYVWPEEWPEGSSSLAAPQQDNEEWPVAWIMSFTDEASITFVPGWAGTYTVEAGAVDNANNVGEKTDTFVVLE